MVKITGILYHGTDVVVDKPEWNHGNNHRDFGQCFYTTYSKAMARDWAVRRSKSTPVVNRYVVNLEQLETGELNIKRFTADDEWAKFIYNNRFNRNYIRPEFDIIVGPLADRGLTEKFAKMEREGLTFADIAIEIEYTRYKTMQVCFCSERATRLLTLI